MKSRHTKPARCSLMILLTVGHFVAVNAHAQRHAPSRAPAGPQGDQGFASQTKDRKRDVRQRRICPQNRLRGAIKRLEKDESCRALFDDLILDGLQALGRTRYQPVRSAAERAYCADGVDAYTAVGRDLVMICKQFHTLHRRTKAAVLIHEALDTAGMSEAPHDPAGMTPEEINEMVEKAYALR